MISRRSHTRRWCRSSFIGSCTRHELQTRAQLVRLAAAHLEQRPPDVAAPRRHTREPTRARAAQHLQQRGLGLIVARVRDENRPAPTRARTRSNAA